MKNENQTSFTWPKIFSAGMVSALVVVAAGWSVAQAYGNQIWAPKKATEESISALVKSTIRNDLLDEQHHSNGDLHMSGASKRATFVTRGEWEADNLRDEKYQAAQEQFWAEQRAVNREILSRLPQR